MSSRYGHGIAGAASNNPGPAAYSALSTNLTKQAPPCYSLSSRCANDRDYSHIPGPGAYKVQSNGATKKSAPMFTMRVKHSPYALIPNDSQPKTLDMEYLD